MNGAPRRIALLGNHLPRQCGIATFTTDLCDALTVEAPGIDCFVLAMNDAGRRHAYPPRVRFAIEENDLQSYLRAADFLNVNTVDVVSLQHEFGIFGGKAGSHVLTLLRELRMPVVTTLHTILGEPNEAQHRVLQEIAALSERVVVMTPQGRSLLRDRYGVADDKTDLIPHGSPGASLRPGSKTRLRLEGKSVLLTFGLLSPDKGIEYVIDAMPAILARFPDTVYVVLGATHPHVVERHGEEYRLSLEARAQELGVAASVIFHNRFVTEAELTEFLSAADICVTPYLQPEQITSGALAYAVGAGKAIISTPFRYANDLLANGGGVLVPWRDSGAIATSVSTLLGDPVARGALAVRAGARGRDMQWPAVVEKYLDSFSGATASFAGRARTSFLEKVLTPRPLALPAVNLSHLRLMTDDTGILQHALYNVPRYAEGYCLDDNARALLLMSMLEEAGTDERPAVRRLAARYLAFVSHAFNRDTGRFHNFMTYGRSWADAAGSEDCHGRAIWALGGVIGRSDDPGTRNLAGDLFHLALPAVSAFTSPRAWAYALLGIDEYLRAFEGENSVDSVRTELATRLLALYQRTRGHEWPWFEDRVTYCNARLSQALIVSGVWMETDEMIDAGTESLEWLLSIQRSEEGHFAPVGTNGFLDRGARTAAFDQQPVEACAIIGASLAALGVTGEAHWGGHARRAFNWFLGHNDLHQALYDASTGACRDGLHADRANENQGAESTLSFLLALVEMQGLASRPLEVREPEDAVATVPATSLQQAPEFAVS